MLSGFRSYQDWGGAISTSSSSSAAAATAADIPNGLRVNELALSLANSKSSLSLGAFLPDLTDLCRVPSTTSSTESSSSSSSQPSTSAPDSSSPLLSKSMVALNASLLMQRACGMIDLACCQEVSDLFASFFRRSAFDATSAFAPASASEIQSCLGWSLRWAAPAHSLFSMFPLLGAMTLQVASLMISGTGSSTPPPNLSDEQVETRAFEVMSHLIQQQGQTRALIEKLAPTSSRSSSGDLKSALSRSNSNDSGVGQSSRRDSIGSQSSIESGVFAAQSVSASSSTAAMTASSRSAEPIRLALVALSLTEDAHDLRAVCHGALSLALMLIYWQPRYALATELLSRLELECQRLLLSSQQSHHPSSLCENSRSFLEACCDRAITIRRQIMQHRQAGLTSPFFVGELIQLSLSDGMHYCFAAASLSSSCIFVHFELIQVE